MSKFLTCCLTGAALCLLAPCCGAPAQEGDSSAPSADMEAMMAEMMQYATPGEHHKRLDYMTGSWEFTTRFRMTPEADWDTSHGSCDTQWVLGGRFLQQNIHADPSAAMPMEFTGLGLVGYDNFAEQYVQLWMDNFFTGVIVLRGPSGESGEAITLNGKVTKPIAGAEEMDVQWVYRRVDDDQFVFEMWEPDSSGELYLHGEIKYTRKE